MKKFKLITLLGIRPDYIRMNGVIKLLDAHGGDVEHVLVHSGQHYDPELYGSFLKEFKLRKPDVDLEIGLSLKESGKEGHGYQQALLNERVYEMIMKVRPDAVIYLGDTNTVLSSVTVARCGVPVIHVEAGGRSYDWRMPEEKNRIVGDHLSDALYSYLPRYKEILISEGIDDFRVKVVGNLIVDPIRDYGMEIENSEILKRLGITDKNFVLITLHREENIVTEGVLENKILDVERFAKEKGLPVVFPVMPRTGAAAERLGLAGVLNGEPFIRTKPLGFFDFLKLEKSARLVVSDSGTVQEESLIVGTPCVIGRRSTERPETIKAGATVLEGFERNGTLYDKMVEAWDMKTDWNRNVLNPEGGSPSERIYQDLILKIENGYFKDSRNFDRLKSKPLVRRAYGLDAQSG